MSTDERISYGEAMAELNRILAEIERDDVDVDTLTERVQRAMELIELCRSRINGTMAEVERIVATAEEPPFEAGETAPAE